MTVIHIFLFVKDIRPQFTLSVHFILYVVYMLCSYIYNCQSHYFERGDGAARRVRGKSMDVGGVVLRPYRDGRCEGLRFD